jgi:hypothetical protein
MMAVLVPEAATDTSIVASIDSTIADLRGGR